MSEIMPNFALAKGKTALCKTRFSHEAPSKIKEQTNKINNE